MPTGRRDGATAAALRTAGRKWWTRSTGSALWKAKAEALAGTMLTAQVPTTGQIPQVPDVDATLKHLPDYCGPGSGEDGCRGDYATLALIGLAELWEADRR